MSDAYDECLKACASCTLLLAKLLARKQIRISLTHEALSIRCSFAIFGQGKAVAHNLLK